MFRREMICFTIGCFIAAIIGKAAGTDVNLHVFGGSLMTVGFYLFLTYCSPHRLKTKETE